MRRPVVVLGASAALLLAVAPLAAAATPRAGTFTGTVAAGYGGPQIQFKVKDGKVTGLLARMFYSCDNGPQTQTVVAPSRTYRLSRSGSFAGRSTESIGGVASETVWFEGRFTSATKAVGTLRSQTVGGGERCETQERRFTLTRR